MATEEKVLCFERKLLEEIGVFQGLSLDIEKYLPVITSLSKYFVFEQKRGRKGHEVQATDPLCPDRVRCEDLDELIVVIF